MRQHRIFPFFICAMLTAPLAQAHQHKGHGHTANGHAHHASPAFPDPASATSPEGLLIHDCWIRGMPANLPSAAYLRMENRGTTPLTLHAANSDAYAHVMLHTTTTQGGMARMENAGKLDIAPGDTLEFAPGGHHVMLEQAAKALQPGDTVTLTLWFGDTLLSNASCTVKPANTLK